MEWRKMIKAILSGMIKSPKGLLILSLLGVLVILIVGGIIVVLLDFPKAAAPAPTAIPTELALDVPMDAQADLLLPEGIPTEEIPALMPEMTATPNILNPVCMRETKQGEWLRKILQSFQTDYSSKEEYFTRSCANEDNQLTCGPRSQIQNVDYLVPGQWVEVPGISVDTCRNNGGFVISGQE
jgi:hypothetical protein